MSGVAFVFSEDQLRAAGERYVAEGSVGSVWTRKADVEGALDFLLSDQAQKLRVQKREETA